MHAGSGIFLVLTSDHMIIILVVFTALVMGMCASITITCYNKIQERREREREYKIRRSKEVTLRLLLHNHFELNINVTAKKKQCSHI